MNLHPPFLLLLLLLRFVASTNTANLPRLLTASRFIISSVPLFSGSLVALALGAPTILGAITPIGGVAMMGGWLVVGLTF